MLLGVTIGVYFTFNICFAVFAAYDDFFREWKKLKWYGWPLLLLFGVVLILGIVVHHYVVVLHGWAYKSSWYYRWWRDTLSHERMMGIANRATLKQLRGMSKANLNGSWPRNRFTERVNERLKEMEQ